jgi:ABC-type uncharacterized transport system substrate-binding protein
MECNKQEKPVINQGLHKIISVTGGNYIVGKEYTCTLYASTNDQEHRASVTTTAQELGGKVVLVFDFTPEQTMQLRKGNCILEIFDPVSLQEMAFNNEFADVRPNSVSSSK